MNQIKAIYQSLRQRWMRWIPIRILSVKHRLKIIAHLQSLGPQDRYLRFGYPATDEQIENYVNQLNYVRDDIYGVFNRRLEIVAMAHLAFRSIPSGPRAQNLAFLLTLGCAAGVLGAVYLTGRWFTPEIKALPSCSFMR
jgi:hypothetical protein